MFGISKALRRLIRNERGNTAIFYALSAVPIMIGVGAGVDYARYTNITTHVQMALDAAAIAGAAAVGKSDDERVTIAEDAFAANLASGPAASLSTTTDFRVEDKTLITDVSAQMPTTLMKLAGIPTMPVRGTAEVDIGMERKAEVVLALDYSGSMEDVAGTKVKYVAMREAATKLVDDLATSNPGKVKFGLVPFSHQVYLTMDKAFIKGASGAGSWTGCTQDRKYPFNLTSATPSALDDNTKWNQPMAPDHAAWGCSGYVFNHLVVKPLTSDTTAIDGQLAVMTPYAWTHIALGAEFAYHLLSDNAPFTEAAPASDSTTQKFMVLLTDGFQTEPAFGPGASRNVSQGESNLTSICNNAKADGITIVTLAFDLDDTATRTRLKNCASGASNFFVIADDTDLSEAFETIKMQIASNLYLKK
ncbi:MAG: VWA domain-containing protein [Hyphomicrobiales bacterium]